MTSRPKNHEHQRRRWYRTRAWTLPAVMLVAGVAVWAGAVHGPPWRRLTQGTSTEAQLPLRNELGESTSPYLRSAAQQPVHWQEWGEDVFALARSLDRPIYLDIGAIWCHWCHVMDRESYENPDIAALINERFIPVKVDRDLRPDIDQRYQRAVAALGGGGGWPLTAFLTPAGEVTTGGRTFLRKRLPRSCHKWRPKGLRYVRRALATQVSVRL